MTAFILIVFYVLTVIHELIPHIRAKRKREGWVCSLLLFVSFCVLLPLQFSSSIPSLFRWAEGLVNMITGQA